MIHSQEQIDHECQVIERAKKFAKDSNPKNWPSYLQRWGMGIQVGLGINRPKE